MENTKHLYIVSFGDSKQYRISCEEGCLDGSSKDTALVRLENDLNEYLKQEFPGGTFAYFTTPKVTEISLEHESQFATYPELTDEAVEDIKKVLKREVAVMDADKALNDNAPWANV